MGFTDYLKLVFLLMILLMIILFVARVVGIIRDLYESYQYRKDQKRIKLELKMQEENRPKVEAMRQQAEATRRQNDYSSLKKKNIEETRIAIRDYFIKNQIDKLHGDNLRDRIKERLGVEVLDNDARNAILSISDKLNLPKLEI